CDLPAGLRHRPGPDVADGRTPPPGRRRTGGSDRARGAQSGPGIAAASLVAYRRGPGENFDAADQSYFRGVRSRRELLSGNASHPTASRIYAVKLQPPAVAYRGYFTRCPADVSHADDVLAGGNPQTS